MKVLAGLLKEIMPFLRKAASPGNSFPEIDREERAKRYSKNTDELGFLGGVLEAIKHDDKTILNIVQVGANDGVTNDPLYGYVLRNKETTRILLIEPQPDVIRSLTENYKWHSSAFIAQAAIGPAGTLKLYRIKDEFHKYYRGITASGITSVDKDYVLNKAVKNYGSYFRANPDDYIEEMDVECMSLAGALERHGFGNRVDLLQIDAEGFDDQVIYNSDLPRLMPSVINYEFIHLSPQRLTNLNEHLIGLGYRVIRWSNDDECAIKVS